MNDWNEIRRKVLVEGVSKRAIRRDYKIGSEALEKILTHPEPPGYRQATPRRKTKLGEFLPVIDSILELDRDPSTPPTKTNGSSTCVACSTRPPARSPTASPPRSCCCWHSP